MRKILAFTCLLIVGLCTTACPAHIATGVSPVADIANAGGKVEDSGQAIFKAVVASTAPQPVKNDVALAVNKLGHAGLLLNASLGAYNQAKAAGSDLTQQKLAIQSELGIVSQFLTDINKALPPGTLQEVDALVNIIINAVLQIKTGVGL